MEVMHTTKQGNSYYLTADKGNGKITQNTTTEDFLQALNSTSSFIKIALMLFIFL